MYEVRFENYIHARGVKKRSEALEKLKDSINDAVGFAKLGIRLYDEHGNWERLQLTASILSDLNCLLYLTYDAFEYVIENRFDIVLYFIDAIASSNLQYSKKKYLLTKIKDTEKKDSEVVCKAFEGFIYVEKNGKIIVIG